jgi:hypothetical protein
LEVKNDGASRVEAKQCWSMAIGRNVAKFLKNSLWRIEKTFPVNANWSTLNDEILVVGE